MLTGIRAVLRTESASRADRPRVRWQSEEVHPLALQLYHSQVGPDYDLGTTPPND
jgi:hypothetical protein